MAGIVSQLNQFPCKNIPLSVPSSNKSTPSSCVVPVSSSNSTLVLSGSKATCKRGGFLLRAVVDDDEWGSNPNEETPSIVAVAEEPKIVDEIESLKKQLVDSFSGTERGLKASSETRAEIVELITKLESKNPNPNPTEALSLLNGKWVLAYTSFSGLFPLLSRGTLPLVKVEEISQTIDSENFTVQNIVQFSGPLATTSITTNATFQVRSPKRVQIKFEEGIIGTPQLTDSIVFPEYVEFLEQKIDLTPFKSILTSVQDTASSVAKTFSSQPPLKIPISNRNAESWLLTTYLDQDLRISRGDAGSVFVLIKDGSPLLSK